MRVTIIVMFVAYFVPEKGWNPAMAVTNSTALIVIDVPRKDLMPN